MPSHEIEVEEMSLTLRSLPRSRQFERTMTRGLNPERSSHRYTWMQSIGSRNWYSENLRSEIRRSAVSSDIEECSGSILRDIMHELGLTIEGDQTMVRILGLAMQAVTIETLEALTNVRSRYDRGLNQLSESVHMQLDRIRGELQGMPSSDQVENLNRIQKKIEQFKTAGSDAERLYAWEVLMGYIDEQTTFEEFTRSRESVVVPDVESFNITLEEVDEAIRTVGRGHRLPADEQMVSVELAQPVVQASGESSIRDSGTTSWFLSG